MTTGEFECAIAFMQALDEKCVKETVDLGWGRGMFHHDMPIVWDLNFVSVRDPDVDAVEVARATEELFSARALKHRKVTVDDPDTGDRMAPYFARQGWEPNRLLVQAKARTPARTIDTSMVVQADWDEIEPTVRRSILHGGETSDPDEIEQLIEHHLNTHRHTHHRYFAARVDGHLASRCELYSDGTTAQIEDVETFEAFRGRGLASGVVHKATEIALEEGHDLVFIVADADDWPRKVYEKLGYDDVGYGYSFLRKPGGVA